jgi:HEAT repeat protein
MNRRQLKKDVLILLENSSIEELPKNLGKYQDHRLINPLFIALCHPVEKVRWHAVCSFGWLVPAIAEKDLEAGRIVMRRFLWSLNDESGGIGWGGPESMAEIMCRSSSLRKEYLHMLISYMREDGEDLFQDGNYLELPMLQRGLLWGIGRLCQDHRQEMIDQRIVEDLSAYLKSSDMHVVGLAIRCLGLIGDEIGLEKIRSFLSCNDKLHLFINNRFQEISVAELVQNAFQNAFGE